MKLKYLIILILFVITNSYSQSSKIFPPVWFTNFIKDSSLISPPCSVGGDCYKYWKDKDGDGYGIMPYAWYIVGTQPLNYILYNNGVYLDCDDLNRLIQNITWYRDIDNDGFGNLSSGTTKQCTEPIGYSLYSNDCNDNLAIINPNTVWYQDNDGDGFGNNIIVARQCIKPINSINNNSDCNDNLATINPNTVWYLDYDGDGFGNNSVTLNSCNQPNGYINNNSDCNDNLATINPNTVWYQDNDGDGFGNNSVTFNSCNQPNGYLNNNSDCNDNLATINPNTVWYQDYDGDGFGNSYVTLNSCNQPNGYLNNKIDCNDYESEINPNSIWYLDFDKDGFGSNTIIATQCLKPTNGVSNNNDCNDNSLLINPNTIWYIDTDLDGFGDNRNIIYSCTQPAGYVNNSNDNCPDIAGSFSGCIDNNSVPNNNNYIKTTSYKTETTTSIPNPAVTVANVNVTYFDGLGRPIQQVAHAQSGSGKDIVTHIEYDGFGRQTKEYLPYVPSTTASTLFKPTAATDVAGYYNSAQYSYCTNAFSEKQFEASPLNRVLQQASPGTDWAMGTIPSTTANHTIKLDYQTNTATEVKLYTATASWQPLTGKYEIALTGGISNYLPNQLYKTITKDENWTSGNANTTEEFKDKEGRVVLKRTYGTVGTGTSIEQYDTYYVFDQYSNLTYVIPPLANDPIGTPTQLSGLCYQYIYDYRNRLIEKKIPGKQWEFIVYDKLDRPIATGPAFSPFNDSPATANIGWLITKYDVFNRPVLTGWQQSTTVTSIGRLSKQTEANTLNVLSETKTAIANTIDSIPNVFYTNNIAPTTFKLLTVNYYDNYDFQVFNPAIAFGATDYNNDALKPKGMPTGSWIRALTTLASPTGESSYTVYDYKARPIKTFTNNYLGGYTQVLSSLDFSGKTLFTETRHKRTNADAEILVREDFAYTPQDRLLTHSHKVNALPTEVLANNTYNELGQLISKNVGGTATAPLQKVDYAYNIRGWLTGINNDPTNNLILNTTEKDLFAFKINYNTVENVTGYIGKELYNGNIAETFWRTSSDNVQRKYGYSYDNLNRLRSSIYMKPEANVKVLNCFNESMNYDKNGNIMALTRYGNYDGSNIANLLKIDELAYTYPVGSNQLFKVNDSSNSPVGFKDGLNTNDDYSYDFNGNMLIDQNKGITSIKYNHLNLPTEIVFNNNPNTKIVYLYSANGSKLQKFVRRVATGVGATTNYLGGYQYLNGILQFFPTAEGYVNNTQVGTVKNFNYVYNYQDHLGNIRLSYSKDPTTNVLKILEENHYYPFGLKHANYNSDLNAFKQSTTGTAVQLKAAAIPAPIDPVTSLPYRFKYNGKELQDELGLNWYDYQARNYDPALGRWFNVDVKSEMSRRFSPYAYAINNPVFFIDPDGMLATPPDTYIDNRTGKVLGSDGAATTNYRLVDKRDFDQISSDNSGTTSAVATNQLQEKSQLIDVNNAQIQQEVQTITDLSRTVEHQTDISLNKYTGDVIAVRGEPGTTSGAATANIRTTGSGATLASDGGFYLANVHGHNLTNDATKINVTGTSDIDRASATSSPTTTIYATDAYNTEVGNSATIGRVTSDGVQTNNVGQTMGSGTGTFNLGQDALNNLPRQ